jgi:hypothetical protein
MAARAVRASVAYNVSYHPQLKARPLMAERSPIIACDEVPLDEARRMSRGPRMDPEISHVLKQKIQSLDNIATGLTIPEGASPTTMKHRTLRVAAELSIPVTVRTVPGGLLFWRSTDKDLQQAKEVVARLRSDRQPRQTPSCARPGRGPRG